MARYAEGILPLVYPPPHTSLPTSLRSYRDRHACNDVHLVIYDFIHLFRFHYAIACPSCGARTHASYSKLQRADALGRLSPSVHAAPPPWQACPPASPLTRGLLLQQCIQAASAFVRCSNALRMLGTDEW
eukprot:6209405-Pleurochrysis_carterae.AAC.3